MSVDRKISTFLNLLLSALFIGFPVYIFMSAQPAGRTHDDLRLYAALTGAYGLWRLVRTIIVTRKSDDNA
ncbi:hypothetical protein [Chlorobium sp.]|jgi:hypothetical protein|uniref:hypothetical protein n=1 Tax=Chlorobium sp. TaxID=1095 RepID=UPI001D9B053F|nr:hypothetical protein [Chlorobium sp.]MBN1279417.1 hypothetical protein [Chlorobiaceae bacterium]MCF8270095.1 hypothetical protein [Chlorobium sp.]MCF8290064.1 hypothetical protein [Chlorobium sp.]MCF8384135.1 hypothetical protein [Chlorobium sp.]